MQLFLPGKVDSPNHSLKQERSQTEPILTEQFTH